MRHPKNPTTRSLCAPAVAAAFSLLLLSVYSSAQDEKKPAPKVSSPKSTVKPVPRVPAKPAPKSTGRFGLTPPPLEFQPPELDIAESVFDWGAVLQGEVVTHAFEIKNNGGSPLRVERVKPSCGCTTVDYDKEIPPGGAGTITLKIETKKFSGTVKKTAEVSTNAGRISQRLTMQGKIDLAVEVDPKLPRLDVVRGVEPQPLLISLKRAANHKIAVKGVTTKSTVVKVDLKEVEAGELYQLVVLPQIPDDTKKYHYAKLDVAIEVNGRSFDIPVRVSMTVKNRITATPASVYFSRRDTESLKTAGAPPATKTVKIESLDPQHSFKITDVQVQGQSFDHKLETVIEGKSYNLIVLLSQLPDSSKRRIVEKILVRTDDPSLKEISLNVTASIGRARTSVTPTASGNRSVRPGTRVKNLGPKQIGPKQIGPKPNPNPKTRFDATKGSKAGGN